MTETEINSSETLLTVLKNVSQNATKAGLDSLLVDMVSETIDKVNSYRFAEQLGMVGGANRTDAQVNKRENYRVATEQEGLVIRDGNKTRILILDMSPQGFGIESPVRIPSHKQVMLELHSSEGGNDLFSCQVAACQKKEKVFRVGLKVMDMLPRF
ncbi:MAG: PilZ domain-containing protein [Magnetococcales bacterium]|nr:PilZ domain-containing protein [Magnetococcales bacterium]